MDFSRMAKAVDELAAKVDQRVIVQSGHTRYDYKNAEHFGFCTRREMLRYFRQADLLILQGGWGAISEAMEMGKRIVVIPRREGEEHIHDQFQLVRKLHELGCIVGVFDERDLLQRVEEAYTHHFVQLSKGDAESLIRAKLEEWFLL